MKKRGFTLIELLATIALISILVVLLLPNLLNMVNNKKSSISDAAKKMIYQATELYIDENESSYSKEFLENNKSYCIKLEDLVDSGKLSSPVQDIKSGKEIPLTYYVRVTLDEYNQFNYNLVNDNECNPEIAYKIKNKNKSTKEKKITINYPNNSYEKKYKVISGTTKENIELNTDITVTSNPTITFTSNGSITFWIEQDGQVMSETTVNITNIDTTNPTLTLAKITYIEDDFSDWTLTNATVTEEDGYKVLTLDSDCNAATAESNYIDVNKDFYYLTYDGYTDLASSTNFGDDGAVYYETSYYNDNKESTTALNNESRSGHASVLKVSRWNNNIMWYDSLDTWRQTNQYGPNVKYIKIKFKNNCYWGSKALKIRKFKFYGEAIPNSFYLINTIANDNSGISEIRYAKGNKDINYFKNYGEKVNDNQIKVVQNGTYSVCAIDKAGNMTVETIVIDKIES